MNKEKIDVVCSLSNLVQIPWFFGLLTIRIFVQGWKNPMVNQDLLKVARVGACILGLDCISGVFVL